MNSYDSGNSLIGTNVTIGKDGTSRSYQPAQADTNYAMYVVISNDGTFTGSSVIYEQKQEYALKFKGADYTFSNFVCNNTEVSTKKDTVASVAQGTNVDYTKDYIVEDTRDNKYYIVRKLYMRADDGTIDTACWMTQNLDLDLVARYETSTTAAIYAYNRENNTINKLTTVNSDLTNDWANSNNASAVMLYASTDGDNSRMQDWRTSYSFAVLASDAAPTFPITTSDDNYVTPSGNNNSGNTPGMIDPGDIVFGLFDSTLSPGYASSQGTVACEVNDTKCYRYRDVKYFATEASGHLISDGTAGNYYNWYAATAGTGNSSITIDGANTQDSICPRGWGLPTGGGTNNEFGKLVGAYFPIAGVAHQDNTTVYTIGNNYTGFTFLRTLKSNSDNMITDTPLSFARSDGTIAYAHGSGHGINVLYWSATAQSSINAYALYSTSGILHPGTLAESRGRAFAIRCVQGI